MTIHRDTLDRLGELGGFYDSFEDVVKRLLDNQAPKKTEEKPPVGK